MHSRAGSRKGHCREAQRPRSLNEASKVDFLQKSICPYKRQRELYLSIGAWARVSQNFMVLSQEQVIRAV